MSLPDQIQKQVDAAKDIIETHYGQPEDLVTKSEDLVEPVVPPSTVDEPVGENAAPKAQEDENSPTYAQRWRSLQGVYHSTQTQLQTAQQRVESLENVIAMMKTAPAVQADSPKPGTSYVTDKDREEYGDDMVDFASRAAKQENAQLRDELNAALGQIQALGQQFQQLQGQVVPTVRQVAQTQQQNAQQGFFNALTKNMPNWEALNGDRAFHQWLLTPDPLTGITRQTYLEDAQKSLDVSRVLSIFKAFAPVTETPSAPSRKAPTSELELQVAPGRSLSAQAPSSNDARKWTRGEITKLYDDNRRGEFRGREDEFKSLERDLFAAQKEGRISP